MTEISSASQEQSLGIEQVNATISQIDEMTQKNTSLVQETTNASAELFKQASNMNTLMNFFSEADTSTKETLDQLNDEDEFIDRRQTGRPWG